MLTLSMTEEKFSPGPKAGLTLKLSILEKFGTLALRISKNCD